MSIKTKVILAMAGLAAGIVLVLFIVVQSVTSSSIERTINQSGIGYVRLVQAFGEQYESKLNDKALLGLFHERGGSATTDPKLQRAWTDLIQSYKYASRGDRASSYHPAHSYASYEELRDDLYWMRLANLFESGGMAEEKAAQYLGNEWRKYFGMKNPPARNLLSRDFKQEDWPFNTDDKDNALDTVKSEYVSSTTGAAQYNFFKALLDESKRTAQQTLEQRLSNESQMAGVAYTPAAKGMSFFSQLAVSTGQRDAKHADFYRLVAGISAFSKDATDISSGESNIVYDEGSAGEKGEVRQYRVTGLPEPQETRVFLQSAVIGKAKTTAMTWLSVVAVLGLGVAIAVAFIVGANIARPLTALMHDINVIATGNFDHHPRVSSKDEVGALAQVVGEMASSLKAGQELWRDSQASKHDLALAKEIQENLLPAHVPKLPGYDLSAYYQPSKEVGGDYYDFFLLDRTHLGMLCADVSGKGVPGSMVMMMAKALIHYEAQGNLSPRDIFVKVNKALAKHIKRGMFVTAYYMILDVKARVLTVASAGHNPLVIYRAATGTIEKVNPGGIALGFDKEGLLFERNMKEQTIQLARGDRVVIYTDGVTEAMSPEGEEWGEPRFHELTKRCANLSSNDYVLQLVNELLVHAGSGEQHDDITVVTLKVE